MARSRRPPIQQLRAAVDALPLRTRRAMLDGLRSHEIVVGAYTHDGGVCPMLAAHRCGGRTSFAGFARAWDRFASPRRPRRATARELRVLVAQLEASILAEDGDAADLAAAIAEHRALTARRRAERPRPGDPDRSRELVGRGGWSWLRPFRRLDDFERAVEAATAPRRGAGRRSRGSRTPASA